MSLKSIPYTLPSSRNCIVNPRQLDLISQRSKRISWMSSTVSVPIFTPESLVSKHAVRDRDVARWPPLPVLPRRLDDDGIVAAHDVAIRDLHVAAMVRVNAVAVRHIQIVADLDAVHQHVLATQHVQPPLRRLTEGNIADLQSLAAGEDEHLRAERAEFPDLTFLVEARHELGGASRDIAGSGDFQVARAVRREHAILVARRIVRLVGGDHQFGIVGQVKIDPALEYQRPDQILLPAADQHL